MDRMLTTEGAEYTGPQTRGPRGLASVILVTSVVALLGCASAALLPSDRASDKLSLARVYHLKTYTDMI